ncbi:MAG: DNA polymerase I [Bacilli bacterium]|jgi:DNA polymerase-1
MNKVILIDGNNLLFRSYYATAYSGNMMKNSKGFPTNALYGFVSMINKIINEEKPTYIAVALDKGKTFRHDSYAAYKAGRIEMPDELRVQFGIAKTILDNMGIKYFEADGYEADDIIGTFSNMIDDAIDYMGVIISSDKDLLQLIDDKIEVKLLKTQDYIRMNNTNFFDIYGIEPRKIIDLKGLQGDSSDNIPGVKGIGEKTALKLLQDYNSVEGIYANIDKITGKLKEKLLADKEAAFMSKQLATIYKEVPLNADLNDIKYKGPNTNDLIETYTELEFYSLLKGLKEKKTVSIKEVTIIKDLKDISIEGDVGIYLEILGTNYHTGKVLGMGIYNESSAFYVPFDVLKKDPKFLIANKKYTYDLKKTLVALKYQGIEIDNIAFDTMLAAYLLNYNIKDDIAYLANQLGYDIPFYEIISKAKEIDEKAIADICVRKAKFIYETKERFTSELEREECITLFNDIEFPLAFVLADMEYTGVNVNKKTLIDMGEEINLKLEFLERDIYNLAGFTFNISSPKQLGEVLFSKLQLPFKANTKRSLSTNKDVLDKLKDKHPIVNKILEHRMLSKIKGTYITGLIEYILPDNKIHTIYNQTLTRTGRLSSSDPNLQNIPIRQEYGRLIRKAFIPSKSHEILSSDYSQIELRVFAHMSGVENLVNAFKQGMDIHTKTAMDIFKVSKEEVNSEMRRKAKSVNFGILYGISSFGLSGDLDIDMTEAKNFIQKYFDTFPGVKLYMDGLIKDAYATGFVKTIMNRKRVIEELNNKNYMIRQQGERMALNTPIQGSSADIIKKAMIDIYNEFKRLNLKSKMIIQVHDELIFDVANDEKEIVLNVVTKLMENCYELNVPLKVETNFGRNWYQAK